MNAIQYFNWGLTDKASYERLKKESDRIYNESLNPPKEVTSVYYKKGIFWYKESSTYTRGVRIDKIDYKNLLFKENYAEIEELKFAGNIIYMSGVFPNLKVIDITFVNPTLAPEIKLFNAKKFEKIYLRKKDYDNVVFHPYYASDKGSKFLVSSIEGDFGSNYYGYISGVGNKTVKGVNILTK